MSPATIFNALGDPTRFAIVERLLADGEASAGELAAPFALSKPAISRHLRLLEDAGVITRHADRRYRRFRVCPQTIEAAAQWFNDALHFWSASLDRLDAHIRQRGTDGSNG